MDIRMTSKILGCPQSLCDRVKHRPGGVRLTGSAAHENRRDCFAIVGDRIYDGRLGIMIPANKVDIRYQNGKTSGGLLELQYGDSRPRRRHVIYVKDERCVWD